MATTAVSPAMLPPPFSVSRRRAPPASGAFPASPRSCQVISADLGYPRSSCRMPLRRQSAGSIDRQTAVEPGVSLVHHPAALAGPAETELLVEVQLDRRHCVVHLGDLNVLGRRPPPRHRPSSAVRLAIGESFAATDVEAAQHARADLYRPLAHSLRHLLIADEAGSGPVPQRTAIEQGDRDRRSSARRESPRLLLLSGTGNGG